MQEAIEAFNRTEYRNERESVRFFGEQGGPLGVGLAVFPSSVILVGVRKLKRLGRFHVYGCVCRGFLGGHLI